MKLRHGEEKLLVEKFEKNLFSLKEFTKETANKLYNIYDKRIKRNQIELDNILVEINMIKQKINN